MNDKKDKDWVKYSQYCILRTRRTICEYKIETTRTEKNQAKCIVKSYRYLFFNAFRFLA